MDDRKMELIKAIPKAIKKAARTKEIPSKATITFYFQMHIATVAWVEQMVREGKVISLDEAEAILHNPERWGEVGIRLQNKK